MFRFKCDYATIVSIYGEPYIRGDKYSGCYLCWEVDKHFVLETSAILLYNDAITNDIRSYDILLTAAGGSNRGYCRSQHCTIDSAIVQIVLPLYKNKTASELLLYV